MADAAKPLPYTANPTLLFMKDLGLFVANLFTHGGLLSIALPIHPTPSGELDELYGSAQNIWALLLHVVLFIAQFFFLASLIPLAFLAPLPILYFIYIVGFIVGNQYFTVLLNGRRNYGLFKSNDKYVQGRKVDEHEKWVFINGVATGKHWLQANLDRLALTFRRPIYGIHNQTRLDLFFAFPFVEYLANIPCGRRSRGVLFDVLECIIQRDFSYATQDIRQAYSALIDILNDPNINKVVLILHSQGAIEGGLVLDWLYATVAARHLSKLEIYTFGNAANHWNAPVSRSPTGTGSPDDEPTPSQGTGRDASALEPRPPSSGPESAERIVRHIEHYANMCEYVARGGILHFRPDPSTQQTGTQVQSTQAQPGGRATASALESNRFVGRLFKRNASGHLLNQHYLNNFFEIDTPDPVTGEVVEENEYMESLVDLGVYQRWDTVQVSRGEEARTNGAKIKDLSRLWSYRNGGNPDES